MDNRNIYYAARMMAAQRDRTFAGRDRAADEVHVSCDALAGYEKGQRIPPCDVVASMCTAYRTPALKNEHMRAVCPLMREGVAECSELRRAALGWVATIGSAEALGREFASLAIDGRIDREELAAALAVRAKAVELSRVMQETITAIDTAMGGRL